MAIQIKKIFVLLISVQILLEATVVECSLGSFMGSLAGSVAGNLMTNKQEAKHYHHYHGTPQTTIERRETLANGCYRQVVKEPDSFHPGKFIETEQLICPPQIPVPGAPVAGVPYPQIVPVQQPMVPVAGVGNAIVLSTKTGSYHRNSGNSLLQTSCIVLVIAGIVAYFL